MTISGKVHPSSERLRYGLPAPYFVSYDWTNKYTRKTGTTITYHLQLDTGFQLASKNPPQNSHTWYYCISAQYSSHKDSSRELIPSTLTGSGNSLTYLSVGSTLVLPNLTIMNMACTRRHEWIQTSRMTSRFNPSSVNTACTLRHEENTDLSKSAVG